MPTFNHPYNFIPAIPRHDLPLGLRDGSPAGHHRWHDELWSGEIAVTMTVVTPLLLMREQKVVDKHRHLEVATCPGPAGKDVVDLAPTQVKGMLRTIYEAVTNSRFGVFAHHAVLGYRAEVKSALDLRPAIVDSDGRIELLGTLSDGSHNASAAVIVPAWRPDGNSRRKCLLPPGFAHGQKADALVAFSTVSRAWEVVSLHAPGGAPEREPGQHVVRGLLHVTGPTIKDKRAERLFVTEIVDGELTQTEAQVLPPGKESAVLLTNLRTLIEHQREVHRFAKQDEVWAADKDPWEFIGSDPGKTAWSRHLYDVAGSDRTPPSWVGLDVAVPPPPGQVLTCWAEPEGTSRLRPVMVSRLCYDTSPGALLDDSLHPAREINQLSAADRVFGWVWPGTGDGSRRPTEAAHRGQLRVVRVETPEASTAVEELDELTIPPLAAPKPGRFYLSPRRPGGGGPPRRGLFNERTQQLSGRKIYPHHQGLEGLRPPKLLDAFRYRPPVVDVTTNRKRPMQDSQNATLRSWVRPGAEFRFVVQVTDLHPLELGALLWLLDPARAGTEDGPARHRIGMGKPLGFGSVELSINTDRTWFCTGAAMRDRLLMLQAYPDHADPTGLAEKFESAMAPDFAPVLAAVRRALTGFPVQPVVSYPRMREVRAPGYTWFVQNEKERAPKWLPALGAEPLTEYDADLQGLT